MRLLVFVDFWLQFGERVSLVSASVLTTLDSPQLCELIFPRCVLKLLLLLPVWEGMRHEIQHGRGEDSTKGTLQL